VTEKELLMQFVYRQHQLGFLFTNAPQQVYEPVVDDFLAEFHLDNGYQAVAFEVGKSPENAMARITELEARPCPYVTIGSEGTSHCALAEEPVKRLEAQLAEANDAKEIAECAAYQYSTKVAELELAAKATEAQLAEAHTQTQAALNQFHHCRQREDKWQARAEVAEARAEAAEKALRLYADKSLWVQYERDGEFTMSLFVGNEAGLDDMTLYDGWLIAEAALSPTPTESEVKE